MHGGSPPSTRRPPNTRRWGMGHRSRRRGRAPSAPERARNRPRSRRSGQAFLCDAPGGKECFSASRLLPNVPRNEATPVVRIHCRWRGINGAFVHVVDGDLDGDRGRDRPDAGRDDSGHVGRLTGSGCGTTPSGRSAPTPPGSSFGAGLAAPECRAAGQSISPDRRPITHPPLLWILTRSASLMCMPPASAPPGARPMSMARSGPPATSPSATLQPRAAS
jgi:hypothetical protein